MLHADTNPPNSIGSAELSKTNSFVKQEKEMIRKNMPRSQTTQESASYKTTS